MNQQTEGPETVRTESVSHPHFNDAAVFERRILSMQSIMAEIGLDSLILSKPENVYYFSRFNPILNSHPVFFIIPAQGKTSFLFTAYAQPTLSRMVSPTMFNAMGNGEIGRVSLLIRSMRSRLFPCPITSVQNVLALSSGISIL
jgi:hypothetical protein